jgi:hypothetical protein
MKKIQTVLFLFVAAFFAACSSGEKRIVVMANGKVTVTDKTISIDPGMTHTEQEVVFKDEKTTITVKSSDGANKTFDLTDNGVYLLNLQRDTLIGGLVNYGATGVPGSITSEQLDHIIDSTKQLMAGQNASDEKKIYFLPPYTIKKVSTQPNARVIGSFKGIPHDVEADGSGKTPEVFKFFTNKQKRETLNDLLQENEKLKSVH